MIVSPDFLDHWKTRMLVAELGETAPLALIRLWAHCQRSRRWSFDLTPAALAAICFWRGDPAKFKQALIACGFLETSDGQTVIHEWGEYNGTLVSNWKNGALGGRPKKPNDNPQETHGITHGLAADNPSQTHREPIREEKIGLKKRKTVGRNGAPNADSEWWAALRANPAYKGIDFDVENGKMLAWCTVNNKNPTRRRFVNWLNRCDKPVGAQPSAPRKPDAYAEPPGWQGWIVEHYGASDLAERVRAGLPWLDVPHSVRTEITAKPP